MTIGNGVKPKKTARKSAPGVPFARGADPRRGGGKKGRSGRKTLEFVAACASLTDDIVLPKVQAYLYSAVKPDDAAWRWCAEYVSGYGKGKPAQPVTGADGGAVAVRVVYDDLNDDGDDT